MRGGVRYALWMGLWVAVSAAALEYALRSGGFVLAFRMGKPEYVLDRDMLYRNRPNSREDIDSWGYRRDPDPGIRRGPRQVVLAGDSFAYGVNVAADATIAAHLERELGPEFHVLNMGAIGYGPDQSLALLRRGEGVQDPELVVLVLYPANDFNDVFKNQLFRVDLRDGSLAPSDATLLDEHFPISWLGVSLGNVFRPFVLEPWFLALHHQFFWDRIDAEFFADPDSARSREKIRLLTGVLRGFRNEVTSLGARLLVPVIPSFEQFADPETLASLGFEGEPGFVAEDLALAICADLELRCINFYPEFVALEDPASVYDPEDQHLSEAGYARVAGRIAEVARAAKLILR